MATIADLLIGLGFDVDASGLNDLERGLQRATKAARSFADQLFSLKGLVAGIVTGAVGTFIGAANMGFEKLNVMLETTEGSAEGAAAAFEKLRGGQAASYLGVQDATKAFIRLKNLGLDPSETALLSYGNTAASMGKNLEDMIEAVADAATGEFERLKEFGIKASQQKGQVSFTFKGATKTIKNSSEEIQKYLTNIGLTDFAGALERQSNTVEGRSKRLKGNLERLAGSLGKGGLWSAINDVLGELVGITKAGDGAATALGRNLGDAVRGLWSWLKELSAGIRSFVDAMGGLAHVLAVVKAAAFTAAYAFATFKLAALAQGLWSAAAAAWGLASAMGSAALIGAAQHLMNLAWSAIVAQAPLYLLSAAVIGVALALQDLWTYLNGGEALFGGFWAGWVGFLYGINDVTVAIFQGLASSIPIIVQGLASSVGIIFAGLGGAIATMAGMAGRALVNQFTSAFEGVKAIVAGAVQWIVTAIQGIPQAIAAALGGLGNLAASAAGIGAVGPRPALAGAGGGSFAATTNITNHVSVPQSHGPAGVVRATGAATSQSVNKAFGQLANQRGRPLR